MKSEFKDYLIAGLWITLLVTFAGVLAAAADRAALHHLGPYRLLLDLPLFLLGYGLGSAGLVRTLLRRRPMPSGTHALDSIAFSYWKLLTVLIRLGEGALQPLVPFFAAPLVPALFGARIGAEVAMGGGIDDPYQVAVGARTILGNGSLVSGNVLDRNGLSCGRVEIGSDVIVGANAIVLPGVRIGDGATVAAGSCVMPGSTIPAGETWRGNPARKWMGPAASASQDALSAGGTP